MDDTFKALEMGAVEILIVWENLDMMRYVLKNPQTAGLLFLWIKMRILTVLNTIITITYLKKCAVCKWLEIKVRVSVINFFMKFWLTYCITLSFPEVCNVHENEAKLLLYHRTYQPGGPYVGTRQKSFMGWADMSDGINTMFIITWLC